MTVKQFPLSEAITVLRSELTEAHLNAERDSLQFSVQSVEVEFQAVLQREMSAGGKIGFTIFGLGSEANASAKIGDAITQKVKITLLPKLDGAMVDVADYEDRG